MLSFSCAFGTLFMHSAAATVVSPDEVVAPSQRTIPVEERRDPICPSAVTRLETRPVLGLGHHHKVVHVVIHATLIGTKKTIAIKKKNDKFTADN